jgi:hypothetical protein
MAKKDILIVAKTYPEISRKYTETVCTAGILAESGLMTRLYPIRFRYLEGNQQFKKYQWIKANIHKATADPRPESYTIEPDSIELGDVIQPGDDWGERCSLVLRKPNVYPSVEVLREAQVNKKTSLGVVKPKGVERVLIQDRNQDEVNEAIAKKESVVRQIDLFEEKKDLYILPIRIMIEFFCDDPTCGGHKMSILDWEFGQLYRRVRFDPDWKEKIKAKILKEIFSTDRDTHVILGNMANHPQVFCVLGFFYPPMRAARQRPLFA